MLSKKEPLSNVNNMIQIIAIGRNHWSVISTCTLPSYKSTDLTIYYYNALYHDLSKDTEKVIISLTSSLYLNKILKNKVVAKIVGFTPLL